jgi:hypothetical protein
MLVREMLEDLYNATSLLASEAGARLSDLLIGTAIARSGRDPVLASRLAALAKEEAPVMCATCGQSSFDLSPSAALQLSLESRLKERLSMVGSMEFQQTWKKRATPLGRPYWEHTASGRRTLDKGYTGWRSPDHNQRGGCYADPKKVIKRMENGHQVNLEDQAVLAGWNTPRATDGSNGGPNQSGGALSADAALAGWATPTAKDSANAANETANRSEGSNHHAGQTLVDQTRGVLMNSSPASTEKRGALNPMHSLWLMNFPKEWVSCGVSAMQSCRRSRRRSSKLT